MYIWYVKYIEEVTQSGKINATLKRSLRPKMVVEVCLKFYI